VKNVQELVAMAKEKPGKLTYGSSGFGTSLQFAAELFKLRAGKLDIVHVPYRGVAPALTDLMGGQIDMLFGDVPVMLPQAKAGTIVPLAVTAAKRLDTMPDVPTMAEAGIKGAESYTFYALIGPAGMPADRVKLLNTTLVQALAEPQIRKILTDQGGIVVGDSPEECRAYIEAEYKKWGEVARIANIHMQ
jgi:tripartite-type tricarboxylate transporter receptor subunit TctC